MSVQQAPDLLSSEELISAAKDENNSNIRHIYDLLFGIVDLMSITLILLPLYPDERNGHIASVALFHYLQPQTPILIIYWILFILLFCVGIARVVMNQRKAERWQKPLTGISLSLSIAAVLFLTMTRVPYATAMAFLLLTIKGVIIYKRPRSEK